MPAYKSPPKDWFDWAGLVLGILFCLMMFLGLVQIAIQAPLAAGVIVAALTICLAMSSRDDDHRFADMLKARSGEGICNFARSFERRDVDPWVIRAVYEEVQACFGRERNLPIRACDDLFETLLLDHDDVDLDILDRVAQRAGRRLDRLDSNPYYQSGTTVGDLVRLFNAQPKASR